MTPEIIIAIGTAVSATVAALVGSNRGGKNSLNGFKDEMRNSFKGVNERLDTVIETQGEHEARLDVLERDSERIAS